MLSVFITPWMKPTFIHCATSAAWRCATASQQREVAVAGRRPVRGRGGRSRSRRVGARLSRSPRAAKYWNVPTRMWLAATRVSTAPGSTCSRNTGSPVRDDRQRPRGRDAERVHRLADQHLAQHRPDRGLAVAAARERRPARALEGDVATPAVRDRSPRRAAAPGRRRAAARSRRTGARRTPGRSARRLRARCCRRTGRRRPRPPGRRRRGRAPRPAAR